MFISEARGETIRPALCKKDLPVTRILSVSFEFELCADNQRVCLEITQSMSEYRHFKIGGASKKNGIEQRLYEHQNCEVWNRKEHATETEIPAQPLLKMGARKRVPCLWFAVWTQFTSGPNKGGQFWRRGVHSVVHFVARRVYSALARSFVNKFDISANSWNR